jgi:amidase
MTDDHPRLDATALAELVRTGEVTPLELVDAAIERIERLDGHINAVIHRRFEQARAEAQSEDLPDGPFRGVPITLKDLWPSSAGDPFHQGVQALKDAGYASAVDSDLVKLYRAAGFIILGRTNTAELGLSATTEPAAHGPTRNPWNLNFGVGGSSGGAAASVAAGMTSVANASDGGGSIRIPAALCGLVGLKPSRGRLPMGPHNDEWTPSAQHVVCHTVRDSAAILDATAVHTLADGVIAPSPQQPFATFVGSDPGSLKVGVCTQARPDVTPDPQCVDAALRVGEILAGLGHQVSLGHPDALVAPSDQSMGMLSMVSTAVRLAEIESIIGRPLAEGDVEPGTWELAKRANEITGIQVIDAQSKQHEFRRRMLQWWIDGWDLLVTPTTAVPAPRLGQLVSCADDPFGSLLRSVPYAVYTSPFNSTGQPAISIPAGFSEDGVPLGVQLVAPYGREDMLIAVAAQLEPVLDWTSTRSPVHP